MDYSQFDTYKISELRQLAKDMGLDKQRSSQAYIDEIVKALKQYEDYKKNTADKYARIDQLGSTGKEGTTYLVKDKKGREYAMKVFRKTKASKTLKREAQLQEQAAKFGVSPKVVEYDTVAKYIVMDKLDTNLLDILQKQKGKLNMSHQKQLVDIFQKLDESGVFHSDPNPLNFMLKDKKMYIIDYGFAKPINTTLIKKYGTKDLNMKFMVLGFLIKMKELAPKVKYDYLIEQLSKEDREKFEF